MSAPEVALPQRERGAGCVLALWRVAGARTQDAISLFASWLFLRGFRPGQGWSHCKSSNPNRCFAFCVFISFRYVLERPFVHRVSQCRPDAIPLICFLRGGRGGCHVLMHVSCVTSAPLKNFWQTQAFPAIAVQLTAKVSKRVLQCATPSRTLLGEEPQTKLIERKSLYERYQAKVSKLKFPIYIFEATIAKLKLSK